MLGKNELVNVNFYINCPELSTTSCWSLGVPTDQIILEVERYPRDCNMSVTLLSLGFDVIRKILYVQYRVGDP